MRPKGAKGRRCRGRLYKRVVVRFAQGDMRKIVAAAALCASPPAGAVILTPGEESRYMAMVTPTSPLKNPDRREDCRLAVRLA